MTVEEARRKMIDAIVDAAPADMVEGLCEIMDDLEDTVRDEGYADGYEMGGADEYKVGYDVGYEEGEEEGYDNGYSEGKEYGWNDGYDEGLEDGKREVKNG
jgi:flagellar biosynthesis/type III secretory pathway protein FliH